MTPQQQQPIWNRAVGGSVRTRRRQRPQGDVVYRCGVPVHPLWQAFNRLSIEDMDRARVLPERPTTDEITVVAPDGTWPEQYERLAATVREALGGRVVSLEHVGSTSIPDLYAKPVIDIDLTVADPADEPSYIPDLETKDFYLVIREPDWQEHRCLVSDSPRCNLHVFPPGAVEPRRHRAFRDWLRTHPDDRDAYAALKRDLATRNFGSVLEYNNEKAGLIYDIYERIFAADPLFAHTPQSR
jgi:GrpB-like predicted nucleotidyltransferase (UPF0157 family)